MGASLLGANEEGREGREFECASHAGEEEDREVECRGCQGNRRGIGRDLRTLIDRNNVMSAVGTLNRAFSLPLGMLALNCPHQQALQKFNHRMSCCTPPEEALFSRGARGMKRRHLAMVTD